MKRIHNSSAKALLSIFLFLIFFQNSFSQTLPSDRKVNWSLAGLQENIPDFSNTVNILSSGGSGNGTSPNDLALQNAIASLAGSSGVIYFPPGVYLFNSSQSIPDSVIIRGHSTDSTIFKFNLSGVDQHLFIVQGSETGSSVSFSQDALKEDTRIVVSDASSFSQNEYVRIKMNDIAITTSAWAFGTVGQIVKISSVDGDTLFIESPLRRTYALGDSPSLKKLVPRHQIGFECFTLERIDSTIGQTSNFFIERASHVWITGVESYNTNFAHVDISASTNILIRGNYFHHAFSYGEGGEGYGVVLEFTSGECLVENNIFNNLRHSMLLQAGSNGNVFGYNYSFNPFWDQAPFPANSSGDLVLHGNYPYANLFEGNIGQNIIIDNSHGINGPFNTFFRNRAELYGIIMNTTQVSDSQNYVGNEIPNMGSFLGNYSLSGVGHFQFGNNVRGTMTPAATENLLDSSLYLDAAPVFFTSVIFWPAIGTPYPYTLGKNQAFENYTDSLFTSCSLAPISSVWDLVGQKNIQCVPNPFTSKIEIRALAFKNQNLSYKIFDVRCSFIQEGNVVEGSPLNLESLPAGVYILLLKNEYHKLIKVD